jgi:ribosomal protein S18 acetylase RimI-like enzyme
MQINDPILSLRPEDERDGAFLARLYQSTRDDLLHVNVPEPMLDDLLEMQFCALQAGYRTQFPGARHFVIENEDGPIGCIIVNHGDEAIRLVYIALLPQERNRGYGRRLIHALQHEAASENKPLSLSVSTRNGQALRLYVSAGFRPASTDGINLNMIWLGESPEPREPGISASARY